MCKHVVGCVLECCNGGLAGGAILNLVSRDWDWEEAISHGK